jgi:hypothetical protein
VSGMMIPAFVFSSPSRRRITMRSCSGLNFMGSLSGLAVSSGWSTFGTRKRRVLPLSWARRARKQGSALYVGVCTSRLHYLLLNAVQEKCVRGNVRNWGTKQTRGLTTRTSASDRCCRKVDGHGSARDYRIRAPEFLNHVAHPLLFLNQYCWRKHPILFVAGARTQYFFDSIDPKRTLLPPLSPRRKIARRSQLLRVISRFSRAKLVIPLFNAHMFISDTPDLGAVHAAFPEKSALSTTTALYGPGSGGCRLRRSPAK